MPLKVKHTKTMKVFYSYSTQDEYLQNELEKHLSLLKNQGYISEWHNREIRAGAEWSQEINSHLNDAQIILLLVSPDFMASDYCFGVEVKRAIERHEDGEVCVIPILLRPVDWEGAPFHKLQCLPTGGKPITSWSNRDEAFLAVSKGIRKVVEEWRSPSASPNALLTAQAAHHREDWKEAPDIGQFYGRQEELAKLKQWIIDDRCRIIAVLGFGGMGKTTLGVQLAKQIAQEFDIVCWQSLQNAPTIEDTLRNCILFLSDEQLLNLPEDVNDQIALLLKYLREHRCLFILDNFNAILQPGNDAGKCMKGYEGYNTLLQRLGEAEHNSCLLLTSREKPKEVARLEGKISPVRTLQIFGVGDTAGKEILKDGGLFGSDETWEALMHLYSGNPLALKIAAEPIREVFRGDIIKFLKEKEALVGDISDLLDEQVNRLSAQELEVLYWLAIEREAVSWEELRQDILHPVSKGTLLNSFDSLLRRFMIESRGTMHFTLQPVIMEYITGKLIEQIYNEVNKETYEFLERYALIKVQTKDYVRESQVQLILKPVTEWLLHTFGKERSERKLKNILSNLRETHINVPSYAAGNVLNILIQLQCDLRGYDFSYLSIQQANLQGVSLPNVNFTHANLETSVFTQTFNNVLSVVFSPDGTLLAFGTSSGSANGEIRVLRASDGTLVRTCRGHTGWVWSVAFSPNGKIIASGSDDQTVRLWDVDTGVFIRELKGHSGKVRAIAFAPDGQTIISGGEDGTMRIWKVDTGECLRVLLGHTGRIWTVAFSPDGETLASGSDEGAICIWKANAYTKQPYKVLRVNSVLGAVAFSPDGKILASGGIDRIIRLWNVTTGALLKELKGHSDWIRAFSFSPDGMTLASSGEEPIVYLWNINTDRCLPLQGHSGWVRAVHFSSDGMTLVSGSDDLTIKFWDVSTGRRLKELKGFSDWIRTVAFSPDGKILASGGDDKLVRLWNVKSNQFLLLKAHTSQIWSVAFRPDGKMLASGCDDRTIRLWDISTGRCLRTLQGHSNSVRSVAFDPSGNWLASASNDKTVFLWEVDTGYNFKILRESTDRVRSVVFNPDGETVAGGGDDRIIRLWNIRTGEFKQLHGHTGRVQTVAFSPDGVILASGGDDKDVRLWDVNSGDCLKILQGHTNTIWSIAFSADGKFASGSNDKTIRIWNVKTGDCLKVLQERMEVVWSVSFSSDGNTLAAGSSNGSIVLWNVQMGTVLITLKSDKLYQGMNITDVEGLSEDQKIMLKALGAIED